MCLWASLARVSQDRVSFLEDLYYRLQFDPDSDSLAGGAAGFPYWRSIF
jgi:hypothetical protein